MLIIKKKELKNVIKIVKNYAKGESLEEVKTRQELIQQIKLDGKETLKNNFLIIMVEGFIIKLEKVEGNIVPTYLNLLAEEFYQKTLPQQLKTCFGEIK